MNNEEIKKDAKRILDKFASALEKVKTEGIEIGVERDKFDREEGEGEMCENFKEKLLDNAPKSDNDFIIAERGDWK